MLASASPSASVHPLAVQVRVSPRRAGLGVMLAPTIYVREHLAAGRLVAPVASPVPSGFGFYLVVNPDTAHTRQVIAFVDWLARVFEDARAGVG